MRIHRMQPEYNLAMGQCYMELGKIEEAIQYFGNVVRARPKNSNGWVELLKCLYKANVLKKDLNMWNMPLVLTNTKPIFIFYKSAFLICAWANQKKPFLQLETAWIEIQNLSKNLLN